MMLNISTNVYKIILAGFRVTAPNIRANARVDANVDDWTDRLMHTKFNRQKTGFLYHAMPEAGITKTIQLQILFNVHIQSWGWLGGAMVLGKFQCRGILLLWIIVGRWQ